MFSVTSWRMRAARAVTATAAAAAHREGARGWAGISQERKCEGGIGISAALEPSCRLFLWGGGKKRDFHKSPHIQNGRIVWNFLLTGNIPPLIVFWFFKRFPSPPSPGCVHLVNIWVESLVAKSEEHRFVFNDTTWRSNLLYGIAVNEGALFEIRASWVPAVSPPCALIPPSEVQGRKP